MDLLHHHRRLQMEHHHAFSATFGVRLARPFWDNLLGLDLGPFDERIAHSGEDESIVEAIERQWGSAARALIQTLMDAPSTDQDGTGEDKRC